MKDRIRFAVSGDPSVLVLSVPATYTSDDTDLECFCVPIESRTGGMLIAVPKDALSPRTLQDGQVASLAAVFGPNSLFTATLVEEAEDCSWIPIGMDVVFQVVDVSDLAVSMTREYDPVTDSTAPIMPFSVDAPSALPDVGQMIDQVRGWLLAQTGERSGFYTAQEDQERPKAPKRAPATKKVTNATIAEQLTTLTSQMQLLIHRQDALEKGPAVPPLQNGPPLMSSGSKFPAVSKGLQKAQQAVPVAAVPKVLALVGPPPRVRRSPVASQLPGFAEDEPQDPSQAPPEDSSGILSVLRQHSTALTTLVAHLAAQSPDALQDLTSSGSAGPSMSSTRGVQRREKMQADLATGASQYFLQLMQQLRKRMNPSKPAPQREEDLSDISMLAYLERHGGYKQTKDLGLIAWLLGHAVDAAAVNDMRMCREMLALLMVGVEQASVDRGDWGLAYLLTLTEEPPPQLFQERSTSLSFNARPFGPLVPPVWIATCLAYLKDLEILSTRKGETARKLQPSKTPQKDDQAEGGEASPKRKARFPKRPKQKAIQDTQS